MKQDKNKHPFTGIFENALNVAIDGYIKQFEFHPEMTDPEWRQHVKETKEVKTATVGCRECGKFNYYLDSEHLRVHREPNYFSVCADCGLVSDIIDVDYTVVD